MSYRVILMVLMSVSLSFSSTPMTEDDDNAQTKSNSTYSPASRPTQPGQQPSFFSNSHYQTTKLVEKNLRECQQSIDTAARNIQNYYFAIPDQRFDMNLRAKQTLSERARVNENQIPAVGNITILNVNQYSVLEQCQEKLKTALKKCKSINGMPPDQFKVLDFITIGSVSVDITGDSNGRPISSPLINYHLLYKPLDDFLEANEVRSERIAEQRIIYFLTIIELLDKTCHSRITSID